MEMADKMKLDLAAMYYGHSMFVFWPPLHSF